MKFFLFLFIAIFLSLQWGSVEAQYRRPPEPPKPKVFVFPKYSKYKRKDTVPKIDYYHLDTLVHAIPLNREVFHDNILKEQAKADLIDGKVDSLIRWGDDSAKTYDLSNALLFKVDSMRVMIENMPAYGKDEVNDHQHRIRYLRAVWEMVRSYNRDPDPDADYYINLAHNMQGMLIAGNEDAMLAYAREYTNMYTLNNIREFAADHPDARKYIYAAIGRRYPRMMIKRLSEYAADSFASDVISAAAPLEPDIVFGYALSTNLPLKKAVYRTNDELVQAIVAIAADSKSPLKALPFLTDLYHKRMTLEQIDSLADFPDAYYENLVRLRIAKDSLGAHAYNEELEYRSLKYFVRQMNELHESPDVVRFRCIDSLSPAAMYYVMVYGQDEIYTSSFLGSFRRLMARMQPMTGDQLLDSLHFDHFRTFIRMCAGYNTLSEFLTSMQDSMKTVVMNKFIDGLERGSPEDLEDAVDVADAFGSIRDTALLAFLSKKVKENYELSTKSKNKKGIAVYSLLSALLQTTQLNMSDTGALVASEKLKLPPIGKVVYDGLSKDSVVYQRMFFFGDKDGQDSYESYAAGMKKDPKWRFSSNKYWAIATSVTGKRIVTYANLPLHEPEDAIALDSLDKYLADSGIRPAIVIHRGHSYHLPMTLARLGKNVKVVILGSCGGYHNLAKVLDRSPEAHIVSSKQTGVMAVNEPILRALNTRLQEGRDINWIEMWRDLDAYFAGKPELQEKFNDYVPPHRNLGAIFIKAYRKMMETDNETVPSERENKE